MQRLIDGLRAVSSAVEHYVDIVGVTCSIHVPPTTLLITFMTAMNRFVRTSPIIIACR
jgi:hypothetical protein